MRRLGYYIFAFLFRPFLWMPIRIWYGLADVFYLLLYYILRYRRGVVSRNLRNAFPDKDEAWYKEITKKFYRHLSDYFIESLKLEAFTKKHLKERCRFVNVECLDVYKDRGQDIIGFLGHYGNWEWITSMPLWLNMKCATVYKPLKNKYFDDYFIRSRQRFGVKVIPMKQSPREIIKQSKIPETYISGLISDQNPGHGDIRYWIEFLNQDTAVFEGGEKIARKIDAAVVYLKMKKVRRGYYETEIIPMFDHASETSEHEITNKYFQLLQNDIDERPELWLWSHKRWKFNRPKDVVSQKIPRN